MSVDSKAQGKMSTFGTSAAAAAAAVQSVTKSLANMAIANTVPLVKSSINGSVGIGMTDMSDTDVKTVSNASTTTNATNSPISIEMKQIGMELKLAMTNMNDAKKCADIERLVLRIRSFSAGMVEKIGEQISENDPPINAIVVEADIIPLLTRLLDSDKVTIVSDSLWVLINVASSNSSHVLAIVDSGAIPKLIRLLKTPDKECLILVMWVLRNIAGDGVQMVDRLLKMGLIPAIVPLLASVVPTLAYPKHQNMIRMLVALTSNLCRPDWSRKISPDFRLLKDVIPHLSQIIILSKD